MYPPKPQVLASAKASASAITQVVHDLSGQKIPESAGSIRWRHVLPVMQLDVASHHLGTQLVQQNIG